MNSKLKSFFSHRGSYLVSVILIILFVLFLSSQYAIMLISPDDVGMKNIVSGVMTGTPDGHCVFIRYPLAAMLASLYELLPPINWYPLFMLFCHVMCAFLILCRAARLEGKAIIWYMLACICGVVILFTLNIVNLEWTTTAGILGMTAIFRYCTIPRGIGNWRLALEYFLCLILLTIGFCLRHTVVMMYIPLAFICWLKRLLDNSKTDPEQKRKIIVWESAFLVSAGVIVLGIMICHSIAYRAPEWKEYNRYTEDRSTLFDYYGYPDYDTYQPEYEAAGISRETYELMKHDYNFAIPTDHFYDIDLHAIAELAERNHTQQPLLDRLAECYHTFIDTMFHEDVVYVFLLMLVLLVYNLLVVDRKDRHAYMFTAGVALWFLGICFYLLFRNRFPTRVALCTVYGAIAALAGEAAAYEYTKDAVLRQGRRVLVAIVSGVLCVAAVLAVYNTLMPLKNRNDQQFALANSKNVLSLYCNDNPDNLYFSDFWSFSQRGDFLTHSYDSPNYMRAGGWMYHSPVYDKMLERYQCYDLLEAIKQRQNVYYLVNSERCNAVITRLNAYFSSIGETISAVNIGPVQTMSEDAMVLQFVYESQ